MVNITFYGVCESVKMKRALWWLEIHQSVLFCKDEPWSYPWQNVLFTNYEVTWES